MQLHPLKARLRTLNTGFNQMRAVAFVLLSPLMICMAATPSKAEDGPLTEISRTQPREVAEFVTAIYTAADAFVDVSPNHDYTFDDEAICSTKNNPRCTQEKVFETMIGEARFMSPAAASSAHEPVTNGKRLQLDNGLVIPKAKGKGNYDVYIPANIIKPGLKAFVNVMWRLSQTPPVIKQSRDRWETAAGEISASPDVYDNKIEVSVDAAAFSTLNHTLPAHLLYDGYVRRTVLPPDAQGNIYVRTHGWGTGNKFSLAKSLNLIVARGIWVRANEMLRQAMKSGAVPVLIIDRSGSLVDQPGAMQQIQSKADEVVLAIQDTVGEAAVINFAGSGSATLDADFTSEPATLQRAIQSPTIGNGGTAIYDAVVGAVSVAAKRDRRSMLIIFTDGENNQGRGLSQAISYCKQNKVPVIVVGFIGTEGRDEAAMNQLADGTDGFYISNEKASMRTILKRFENYGKAVDDVTPAGAAF